MLFRSQGTDPRLNTATAILRGIIYLLASQQPFLNISHLRQKYHHAGRKLFEDNNAFYSLSNVFRQMIQDSRLTTAYLVVDALDECEVGLPELLDLITSTLVTAQPTRVKWILSSRNRDDIGQRLWLGTLELNLDHIQFRTHKVELPRNLT